MLLGMSTYTHDDDGNIRLSEEGLTGRESRRAAIQERQEVPPDRPAIFDGLGPHDFVESEFAPGSGRCDKCGGGPLAPIHLKPVDQMARIADALERIADVMEDAEQTAADRLGADSINNLVRGLTKEGM